MKVAMYYYIWCNGGISSHPFLCTGKMGQMIRDTHFNFIGNDGDIKKMKLIITDKKYWPEIIIKNLSNYTTIDFEYRIGTNEKVNINDKITIQFQYSNTKTDAYYVYCPTLFFG
jgi:hypothetical protein